MKLCFHLGLRASSTWALAMLLATGPLAAVHAAPETLDRVVAVVNKQPITQRELDARLAELKRSLTQQGVAFPADDVLRPQLLDRMVLDQVQMDFAQQSGIKVDDAQLEGALQRMAEQNKMTTNDMRQQIEKEGMNYAAFREDIRRQMTMARLREREVDARVNVSESEVDRVLKQQSSNSSSEQEYHLQHILVLVPEGASAEVMAEKKQKAEAAQAALKAGKAFTEVAATYSDAKDALQGGDMGWRSSARLPELFVEAAKKLQPNETSTLLQSSNGFHLVRLVEQRQTSGAQVEKTHARHILLKVSDATSDDEARTKLLALKEKIAQGSSFESLAQQASQDLSGKSGGDLGWLAPGDTVPAFDKAMQALKAGEVSDPVRTEFGWHLIQVLERKREAASDERARAQIRQELRGRKADASYEDWARQLRDSAYVKIKLK